MLILRIDEQEDIDSIMKIKECSSSYHIKTIQIKLKMKTLSIHVFVNLVKQFRKFYYQLNMIEFAFQYGNESN